MKSLQFPSLSHKSQWYEAWILGQIKTLHTWLGLEKAALLPQLPFAGTVSFLHFIFQISFCFTVTFGTFLVSFKKPCCEAISAQHISQKVTMSLTKSLLRGLETKTGNAWHIILLLSNLLWLQSRQWLADFISIANINQPILTHLNSA